MAADERISIHRQCHHHRFDEGTVLMLLAAVKTEEKETVVSHGHVDN